MSKESARSSPASNASSTAAANAVRKHKKILVVDDEKDIVDTVAYNLRRHGYDVTTAADGTQALESALRDVPDLVLLDLMLPGIDGMEVTRRLKADPRTANVPLIILSAKGEESDVVIGLTLGADDYVTKPFSMKILLARLSTVLRRGDAPGVTDGTSTLRAGPLTIDQSKHVASVDDEPMKLTLTEFKLLSALLQARGRVLTRDQLMDKAMGVGVAVTDRAIDVHVTAIRRKLGSASWLIHTVRGVGYRLQESAEEPEE